ncbi:FecR family protein [Sunxiuqinia sp. A32]|uniref:FecR family protein n=1 Tax=Sunxiuqinia sp. A32 TaxID=3461496 RepID=UPI0040455CBC
MKKGTNIYEDLGDLLTDQKFVDWVKNPTPELDEYWNIWIGESTNRKEQFEQAVLLLRSVRFEENKNLKDKEDLIWKKIELGIYSSHRHSKDNKGRIISLLNNWKINRVAAIALILIIAGGLFAYLNYQSLFSRQPELITVVTNNGEKQTVKLPDGSQVMMNSGSRLTYPSFFKKQRNIELSGEAFFRVAKDLKKPFVVHSKGYTTQALGTSFNVKAYQGEEKVSIALKTGKVVINSENKEDWESVYLDPGQKLDISGIEVLKSIVTNDDLSWQDGVLVLNRAGFEDFVKMIERWYGVEVEVHGNPGENWRVNGRFKNKTLAVVLESISFAENINYTLQGTQVEISFK